MHIPLKSIMLRLIDRFTKIILGESRTLDTDRKLIRFLIFGSGMLVAKFLSIAAQIIMGRTLGPEVYGQITIILLLASYFVLPMVNSWGLVFTKIAAQKTGNPERLQALKSLLLIVLSCSIAVTAIMFTLRYPLSELLDIDRKMMQLTIFMTVFYGWWILSKQIAQGFQNWNLYVKIENIWAGIVLTGLFVCIVKSQISLITVSLVFFSGYFIAGISTCMIIWRSIAYKISITFTKDIVSHGWLLLLSSLVGVATFSIDRILINKSLGPEEVGIYQAHFLATYGIISAFMTILLTYVFPTFCRDENNTIHTTIEKICIVQYPITIALSIFTGVIILWLYAYPASFTLLASLCLFNAVQFHVQLKTWYIASKGARATIMTLKSQTIFLVTNVVILLSLIKRIGIISGGISLLLAACASLVYLNIIEKTVNHERTV